MNQFEVRVGDPREPRDFVVVVRRYSKYVAEQDVLLLAMFGRKAWVVAL